MIQREGVSPFIDSLEVTEKEAANTEIAKLKNFLLEDLDPIARKEFAPKIRQIKNIVDATQFATRDFGFSKNDFDKWLTARGLNFQEKDAAIGPISPIQGEQPKSKLNLRKDQVKNIMIDLKPKVKPAYLNEHLRKLPSAKDPNAAMDAFFTGLDRTKIISMRQAMSLRRSGMFKKATKEVYQELKTGDFWKISDDGKTVVRLFQEDKAGCTEG